MKLGIDGWNLRGAGGVFAQLPRLLGAAEPRVSGVEEVTVWSNRNLLDRLPDRLWLRKMASPLLDRSLPARVFWHEALFPDLLRRSGCGALWCPAGLSPRRSPVPTVVTFRNSLPFEQGELAHYPPLGVARMRFDQLRRSLSRSFRQADGVIFLTEYARSLVLPYVEPRNSSIIPHGIEDRFLLAPRPQKPISTFSPAQPFRFLYVSNLHPYKHPANAARAVAMLRSTGLPVALDIVGAIRCRRTLRELRAAILETDPTGNYLRFRGPVAPEMIHAVYHQADGFLFASSCENLPNILVEAMSASLPIACSNRGPMPEVLREAGLYFDPMDLGDMARVLRELVEDPGLRQRLAERAFRRAGNYSWNRCARATLDFITAVTAR